ncbi:hypothetical protein N0V87_009096 [Didymella glomerata]|uniref:Uncharacterized protein n=1 Tax=Didymella glomerata TaxID=749621 RepID=A0A9W8WS97_9PLEO|nr:hypothetical protein N0V87_009096 [Didymella glomerata]
MTGDILHCYDAVVRGLDIWARILKWITSGGRRLPNLNKPENHPWVPGSPWKAFHEEIQAWRELQERGLWFPDTSVASHAAFGQAEQFAYVNLVYHLSLLFLNRDQQWHSVAELLDDAGKHVLLGSRSVEKGTIAVEDLKSCSLPGSVELLQIDTSDDASIVAAAKTVEAYVPFSLEALVNNAATGYGDASDTMFNQPNAVFRTNAAGAYATAEAFEPVLRKSSSPRIIYVTSGAGSLSRRLEANTPFYKVREPQYRVSKAVMNMTAACQMVDYQEEDWKEFLYCPRFCESNLGPQNKASNGAKPASEGAKPMVDMLNGKRDDEAGKYSHYGGEYPW